MPRIQRALLSVFDKAGIEAFAKDLVALGVELISTGGTAKALRGAGLKVLDISEVTGFPEMLDGRVKTLHPKIHGGLLYRRDLESHRAQAAEHGIAAIDLVVVNLYPFEATVARPGIHMDEAIEQIDIGGPSMLRSASKNWESVTVVCDPADYAVVLDELRAHQGQTRRETRLRLAAKVFSCTARYDAAICGYLEGLGEAPPEVSDHSPADTAEPKAWPTPSFFVQGRLRQGLRYGENPHQRAAFYALSGCAEANLAAARQLSGKELSFNNILDLASALEIVKDFSKRACACILKHNNPCGAAVAESLREAFTLAYAGDPLSAFGGVIGLNREVDAQTAGEIAAPERFVEAIVAPSFTCEAVEILTTKPKWGKNVRLLECGAFEAAQKTTARPGAGLDVRMLSGGLLVQDRDRVADEWANLKTVTKRAPSPQELAALQFAQVLCKHVKSNAIVFARSAAEGGAAPACSVVGVGAGQMSRVDSVEIAAKKAGARAQGAVMASDAFFPFPDGVEAAAKAGVTAVIQPGGSVKDDQAIAACDRLGLAMVTTGIRHFRH